MVLASLRRKATALRRVIEHPGTPEAERIAAQNALTKVQIRLDSEHQATQVQADHNKELLSALNSLLQKESHVWDVIKIRWR